MAKVVIVGGGPAGSACAIECAKSGLEVELHEAGQRDRDKTCGDGLISDSQRALKHLGVFDQVASEAFFTQKALLFAKREERIELDFPVYTLPRRRLDQMLRDAASDLGANVTYESRIQRVNVDSNHVSITDGKNVSEGDVLVLATGAAPNLAKQLGFVYPNASGAAIRGYMQGDIDKCIVWMTKDLAPAYAWAFPEPNKTMNVGLGYYFDGEGKRDLHQLLGDFVKKYQHILGTTEFIDDPKVWPLRCGLRAEANYADRVLLVGENAHCTYDLTGEGIGKALETGIFAAQTIAASTQPYDAKQLSQYQDRLETTRKFYDSYKQATDIMGNPWQSYVFTKVLERSSKARALFSAIAREEKTADELFSASGLFKTIF